MDGFIGWPLELSERYKQQGVWEGLTISEMVERSARQRPDQVAVTQAGQTLTYAQLIDRSKRLAVGLHRAGLRAQDRVVMQLPNSIEFVVTYLALNWIGAIPVMALRAHRHAEVRHFIRASGAVAYIVPGVVGNFDFRTMAQDVAPEFANLAHVWVAGEPLPGQAALMSHLAQDLSAAEVDQVLQGLRPDPDQVATMLLSGGTTSMSKLIPRTHNDYVLNAKLCGAATAFNEATRFMAILPLAHNYNLASPGILATFYYGGTVVLSEGTSSEEIFQLIQDWRVTVVAAVVPLIINWLNSDLYQQYDLSSLRVVQNGGARLPTELRMRLRERLHCIPQEIYGTAEGLINMTRLDDSEDMLLNSSGAPVSDLDEIRVVDDDGHEVADGVPGELVTRGPYTIRGYYMAPEKNAEAFMEGGWYRMGDIVRREGRYVFTEGRRKDLINRGGEKISCDEVENLILTHPKVKSVALVAMPDPVFGEKACACVVPQAGQSLSFEELVAHLKTLQIASFKLPERLVVMDAFPVSPVGKILKRELRDHVATL
ncbi:(2,3-dihydroxybenzoyl)adenylate synthase [Limnohabitans sp.]|uniref:(2,3-dihydroxybenzoyl)adenylate synthase n=1 Tax=Limnohabitans sp. TaxID=1907725 RepID=UPI0038B71596